MNELETMYSYIFQGQVITMNGSTMEEITTQLSLPGEHSEETALILKVAS